MLTLIAMTLLAAQSRSPDLNVIPDGVGQPELQRITTMLAPARRVVKEFFGSDLKRPLTIRIYATRAGLDRYVAEKWKAPKTEPWMVAAGVADGIVMLAPSDWRKEAIEHDPDNDRHVAGILTHELVHVFHAQHGPDPSFEGMDDVDWLVEGIATYASGQMSSDHAGKDRQAIEAGLAPTKLSEAWKGKYRYAVAGSIVRYVDHRFGRKAVLKLLSVKSTLEALKVLGVGESQLIDGWIKSVLKSRD